MILEFLDDFYFSRCEEHRRISNLNNYNKLKLILIDKLFYDETVTIDLKISQRITSFVAEGFAIMTFSSVL